MRTLDIFFYLKAFNNSKLFRMLALCMLVALLGAFAPSINADDFRFTVTVDSRDGRSKFQHVLDQITQNVEDEGVFHISPGDIDPPWDTYQDLVDKFGSDVRCD